MTKEQMEKHLRLMRVSLKHSITYLNTKHELNEEDKEDLKIYQGQVKALDMAIDKLEKLEKIEQIVNEKGNIWSVSIHERLKEVLNG